MTVADIIQKKLLCFEPEKQVVIDESHKHAGHSGAPAGGESHFNVLIVTSHFKNMTRVKRHQAIYKVLEDEMRGPIHALSLQTMTPDEYQPD